MSEIGEQWDLDRSETTLFPWRVDPCKVGEGRVDGTCHNFRIQCLELLDAIAKCDDLRWTDKREVQRIEEKHQVLSLVVREFELFELAINDGGSREVWSRLGDLGFAPVEVMR